MYLMICSFYFAALCFICLSIVWQNYRILLKNDKFSDKKKKSCTKFYDFILQPSLFTSFIYYVFNSKPSSTTEKSV